MYSVGRNKTLHSLMQILQEMWLQA